eukprot:Seg2173.3 transcript_id=Seg2173.3/GoldUCD/mRNA.D3Y31 product="Elongation factor Ts mitochondrial" protein_id=Seg2173.3/GoldUCD/D3Y31
MAAIYGRSCIKLWGKTLQIAELSQCRKVLGIQIRWQSGATSTQFKVDKSLLAKLRKESGSPFSKCHNALTACNNDYAGALNWLDEMAQKEGWKKVEKVKGRQTFQGLVGAIVHENIAAIVEVNCETDFVSRNEVFKNLTVDAARGALKFKQRVIKQNALINSMADQDIAHLREVIPSHDLEDVTLEEQSVKEKVVSAITHLGENVVLNRAVTIATPKENVIGAYAHGNTSGSVDGCLFGKYVALVVLKQSDQANENDEIKTLATGLAQHVVGMKPSFIDKDENDDDAELALLNQEYLLDGSVTVRKLLNKSNTKVIDFVRYQCGG